jgi:hypothetical protein
MSRCHPRLPGAQTAEGLCKRLVSLKHLLCPWAGYVDDADSL